MVNVFNLILKTTRIIKTFFKPRRENTASSIKIQESQQNVLFLENIVVTLRKATTSNQLKL